VAASLPDSDFMGPVYANRRAALAIMVIGTALAVGAGVALSAAIARSLGGATRALHGIAKFELQQPPRRRSMLREVAQGGPARSVEPSLHPRKVPAPRRVWQIVRHRPDASE